MLEEPEVVLRRPDEDRHLVERHATLRLVEHSARDLDRFAALAGRGKQPHVARRTTSRRPLASKDVTPKMGEVRCGISGILHAFDDGAQTRQHLCRHAVTVWHRREHIGHAAHQCGDELALDDGVERHIEQDKRLPPPEAFTGVGGFCRLPEERGAIVHRRACEFRLDSREERADVARRRVGRQTVRLDTGEPQLVNRPGQRDRKPWHPCHWREVRQIAGGDRVEDSPCSDRLGSCLGCGRAPRLGKSGYRHARRQLSEAEPAQAEGRPSPGRNRADEVVRRTAGRTDDHRFSC